MTTFTRTAPYVPVRQVDVAKLTIGCLERCPICARYSTVMPGARYCPDCHAIKNLLLFHGAELKKLYTDWQGGYRLRPLSPGLDELLRVFAFESVEELLPAYERWEENRRFWNIQRGSDYDDED